MASRAASIFNRLGPPVGLPGRRSQRPGDDHCDREAIVAFASDGLQGAGLDAGTGFDQIEEPANSVEIRVVCIGVEEHEVRGAGDAQISIEGEPEEWSFRELR